MRRQNQRLVSLRAVAMFQTCTDKELMRVAQLAEELDVPAGDVLAREGERGHEFYVLVSGRAEVSRDGTVLAELGPGDSFGELALLDPQVRSASVTMTEGGRVLEVTQREFWQLLHDVPALPLAMLQGLARSMHRELARELTST